jgi:trans-aconitate 2-methyltransferase
VPRDWDAESYDRLPIPMTGWGWGVVDRIPLRGDERVLDAGCGTGQVTAYLSERLPRGEVVALDGSPSMIERARERLGEDRVTYLVADLLEPIDTEPVDVVVSTATFHWISDHDRLFRNLAAILRPGGRLVAQCGGEGNIANVTSILVALGHEHPWDKVFAGPAETEQRLRAAGFTSVECWLTDEPTVLPRDELERYLRAICLGGIVDGLEPEAADDLVRAVAQAMPESRIDYVRLNIDAERSLGA